MTDKLDRLAEVCLEAHALIGVCGTPAMRAMIRVLLFQIARELARRKMGRQVTFDGYG